jgi:hypothetical protein
VTVHCQVCHDRLPLEDAHDGGFGSCGEELFLCERHCPECAADLPDVRHGRVEREAC